MNLQRAWVNCTTSFYCFRFSEINKPVNGFQDVRKKVSRGASSIYRRRISLLSPLYTARKKISYRLCPGRKSADFLHVAFTSASERMRTPVTFFHMLDAGELIQIFPEFSIENPVKSSSDFTTPIFAMTFGSKK